ncbi:MAG TPA: Gfo/Idh/MocA family oxidoreductase [Chthoniobacterales bacterium]|jgi:predicted dehydrogenase|nr:Gfo/Idh/MocA family oxidoreductase [Chthoniobacterales bacterium]
MNAPALATIEKSIPATRKPRLGFLGVGWIGANRLAALAKSDLVEIAAVADPVADLVEKATAHAPEVMRFSRLEELLECGLDGVVIATPSAQHAAQSIAALERGFSVFCQKPLGRNRAEVERVIDAGRTADRLIGVDLSYRFTRALQSIRQLVRSGELGEVFAVDLVFHNAYGPDKSWFYDPAQSGGGCLIDLGIHLVDAALWILESPIVRADGRLYCKGKRLKGRRDLCEDYATARLESAAGTILDLACSWNLHAGCDAVIEAACYGAEGGAAMRNLDGSFFHFTAERFTRTGRETLTEPSDDWMGRAALDWAQRLSQSARYDSEIERLLEVSAVLDSIYEGGGDD